MTSERDHTLESLIRNEWPKLRRFFRTKAPDAETLDLVQQTMLAFVEGRARAEGSERWYLWGIAHKQVLKLYGKHRSSVPFDSSIHTAMDLGPSLSSRIDQRTRLLRALHALPLDHQSAFELRHGEGLSLQEVSEALGVSLATTNRYLSLAQTKLRELLGDDAEQASADYRSL